MRDIEEKAYWSVLTIRSKNSLYSYMPFKREELERKNFNTKPTLSLKFV